MPPRNVTANSHSHANNGGSGKTNGKPIARGPHDHPRTKREETKVEEPSSPSGPIIKAQITNTAKASSGKSFLDALRVRVGKGASTATNNTPAAVEQPPVAAAAVEAEAEPTKTVVEAAAAAVITPEPEVPVVETVAAPVEEAAEQIPTEQPPVVEPIAAVPNTLTQQQQQQRQQSIPQQQQQSVMLPETNAQFSWANDDDYSFVNQFTQSQPAEQMQPAAPVYAVHYPECVISAHEKDSRVIFKAPEDTQTLKSAFAELEEGRRKLNDEMCRFEVYRKQVEAELTEKVTRLDTRDRQLTEREEKLKSDCKEFEQKQQMQQQQQQHAHPQQSSARNVPMAPPAPTQQSTQSAPGYGFSPNMQDNMQWAHPPRSDNWSVPHAPVVPPYGGDNRYYPSMNYQPHRGKPFNARGGDMPMHMGRGNNMRPNSHMSNNFNNRPMGSGELRGPMPENGPNPVFNPRSQVGYVPSNNYPNAW